MRYEKFIDENGSEVQFDLSLYRMVLSFIRSAPVVDAEGFSVWYCGRFQ